MEEKDLKNAENLPEVREDLAGYIDFMPDGMRKKAKRIPKEMMSKSLDELAKMIIITDEIKAVREAFWSEYWRARAFNKTISVTNISDGICCNYQLQNMMNNTAIFAYILKPVMKYEARIHALLSEYGTKVVKDILAEPCVDESGNYNVNLASLKLRAIKQLEDRLQGTPVQRYESKNLEIKVDSDMSVDEINKKLAEIESKLTNSPNLDFEEAEFTEEIENDN